MHPEITVESVQLDLAREEAAAAARGNLQVHDTPPAELISALLDAEEQQ